MTLRFINDYIEKNKNRNKISNLISLIISDRKKFNDIDTYILYGTFKQKLYHYINQSRDIVKCSVCGNNTNWNERSFLYSETCSSKCSGKLSKRINSKKKQTYPKFDTNDELLDFLHSGEITLSKNILSKNYPSIMELYNNEPIQKYLYNYFYGNIKCFCCDKDSKFISFNIGYEKYCSRICEQFDENKNITSDNEVFKLHKKSGYYVSNFGRVKGKHQDFLTLTKSPNGYICIGPGLMHRIVIETFIGEIPINMEIDHIDCDKTNNNLSNLEIVSKSENQKRKYKNLPTSKKIDGEKNPMSKLTEEDVLKMYIMFKENKTDREIAILYKLHTNYISLVRYGKRWGYLFEREKMDIHYSFGQKYTKEQMYEVIKMILDGYSNIYISNITNIKKDMISRVRHKKVWSKVWETYVNKSDSSNNETLIGL